LIFITEDGRDCDVVAGLFDKLKYAFVMDWRSKFSQKSLSFLADMPFFAPQNFQKETSEVIQT
jgi:hypothetical protein